MTYLTGIVTVVHNESQVDFDEFVYSGVYCNVGATYTINGTLVTMVAGDTLEILVQGDTTILSGTDFLLVGNPQPVQTEFKTGLISGSPHNEVWQFVNIKTGNPTG